MTGFEFSSYRAHLNRQRLMGVRCATCGTWLLPPRPRCLACDGQDLAWAELAGTGTLAAFTVIYTAPSAMLAAGYGRDNPYCCGIVRLTEGPAISAQIVGIDATHPEALRLGAALRATFIARANESVLAFRPAEPV